MKTSVDKDNVRAAYEDVRSDGSETMWASFKYDENQMIVHEASGVDFEEFQERFGSDERAFGFLRVVTGDELSKRAKFVFIAWCGSDVSPIKRAKLSTDKPLLKQTIQNFAIELLLSEPSELNLDFIATECRKAGGANYGTGGTQ